MNWAYLLVTIYVVGFLVHWRIVASECERMGIKPNAWIALMLVIWPIPAVESAYHALTEDKS